MRVWVLTTEYKPNIVGGLGVVATDLAEAMKLQGVDVSVVSMCHKAEVTTSVRNSVGIIRFPDRHPYYAQRIRLYRGGSIMSRISLSSLRKPNVIHVHSVQFTEVAQVYKRLWNVPVVYTCHSLVLLDGPSRLKTIMATRQEMLLRMADRVVVPSHWLKQKVDALYPTCRGKIKVIPNGVRSSHNVQRGSKYKLLYVGRLMAVKGVEELLYALALLVKSHPRVRLDFAGTCSPTYMQRLRHLTYVLKIQRHVRWLGFLPSHRVSQLYSTHGCLIVPSYQESFGLTALESLAAGLPLIATQSGGLGEFVSRNVACVIRRPNAAQIAHAVRSVWLNPHETAARVRHGRRLAGRLNWGHAATQYRGLFQQLLRPGRR